MVLNAAFYQFATIADVIGLRDRLKARTQELELGGSILVSEEGINCMLAGEESPLRAFISELETTPPFRRFTVKESLSEKIPFTRMLVKIKKEIIPMGRPDVKPAEFTAERLLPVELKKWLDEGKDLVLLDTRNEYEIKHGSFKGARRMGLRHFRTFPDRLKKAEAVIPNLKDKTVVMFCTGGIRCEKAAALALKEEFKEVYQLEGGILRYFEDVGGAHYNGNCFVFDQRVAVKPDLQAINEPWQFHRATEDRDEGLVGTRIE